MISGQPMILTIACTSVTGVLDNIAVTPEMSAY